jgi:hypothetical protein
MTKKIDLKTEKLLGFRVMRGAPVTDIKSGVKSGVKVGVKVGAKAGAKTGAKAGVKS